MIKQLTGKVGSVWQDKEHDLWWGWYDVTVWYDGVRYAKRVEFKGIKNHENIPWQDEPISVEFDTETKEITIL